MPDSKNEDKKYESPQEGKYQKIAVVDNEIEADILTQCLNDMGIPHNIRSFTDSAYSSVFQLTRGWGQVNAPIEYQDAIVDILEEMRSGIQIDYTDDTSSEDGE